MFMCNQKNFLFVLLFGKKTLNVSVCEGVFIRALSGYNSKAAYSVCR